MHLPGGGPCVEAQEEGAVGQAGHGDVVEQELRAGGAFEDEFEVDVGEVQQGGVDGELRGGEVVGGGRRGELERHIGAGESDGQGAGGGLEEVVEAEREGVGRCGDRLADGRGGGGRELSAELIECGAPGFEVAVGVFAPADNGSAVVGDVCGGVELPAGGRGGGLGDEDVFESDKADGGIPVGGDVAEGLGGGSHGRGAVVGDGAELGEEYAFESSEALHAGVGGPEERLGEGGRGAFADDRDAVGGNAVCDGVGVLRVESAKANHAGSLGPAVGFEAVVGIDAIPHDDGAVARHTVGLTPGVSAREIAEPDHAGRLGPPKGFKAEPALRTVEGGDGVADDYGAAV